MTSLCIWPGDETFCVKATLFGIPVWVTENTKYGALDPNGDIYAFDTKPDFVSHLTSWAEGYNTGYESFLVAHSDKLKWDYNDPMIDRDGFIAKIRKKGEKK